MKYSIFCLIACFFSLTAFAKEECRVKPDESSSELIISLDYQGFQGVSFWSMKSDDGQILNQGSSVRAELHKGEEARKRMASLGFDESALQAISILELAILEDENHDPIPIIAARTKDESGKTIGRGVISFEGLGKPVYYKCL
jgi:hypothetical protein